VGGPDWPAIEGAITSAAIVVGGLWAGWKWGYGEALRRRRELPDLDGTLSGAAVALAVGKVCLTLQSVWHNPGPGPIRVCPDHSFVEQYELAINPPLGSFRIADCPGMTKIATVPWRYRAFIMGPQTESVVTEHFVISAGQVYAFNWQICMGLVPSGDRHPRCHRELIWGSPPSRAPRSVPKPAAFRPGYQRPRTARRTMGKREDNRVRPRPGISQ
jgi:hypothetical protein